MKRTIVIIDGMGGGIGAQLTGKIRETLGDGVEIVALGTNAVATERMLKAGADRGATGENAIKVSVRLGEVILGPIGIVIPDSLMGEISPSMVKAILNAPGKRVLLPVAQEHFRLAGIETQGVGRMVAAASEELRSLFAQRADA